jgi:protein tyrosine phosphatase (PTP) superfamily phosphohydrolase (DUF442 family)
VKKRFVLPIVLIGLALVSVVAVFVTGVRPRLPEAMNDVRRSENATAGAWAEPMELPGVPNLHRVSDDLYRGAQPTAQGMAELHKMGIKTIVNLRSFHSDRDEIGDLPLGYEHMTMKTWHAEDKEVVRFLRIVGDEGRQPVFVHCQRGADRTGTMCAIYRVFVQGWSKDDAIAEMTEGGFGFYEGWQNLIDYIRELDVERIRERAGAEAD